jgi:hypothetical protein
MAQIEIATETEGKNNWSFEVRLTDDGTTYEHDVTLDWSDYDLWSHGRVAPERVVEAAFEFLLTHEPAASILTKFNCSVIRRYFPDVDQALPKML